MPEHMVATRMGRPRALISPCSSGSFLTMSVNMPWTSRMRGAPRRGELWTETRPWRSRRSARGIGTPWICEILGVVTGRGFWSVPGSEISVRARSRRNGWSVRVSRAVGRDRGGVHLGLGGRIGWTEKRALIGGAPGCQGSQRSGDRKPPSGPMEGVRREFAIDFDRFVCLKRAGS